MVFLCLTLAPATLVKRKRERGERETTQTTDGNTFCLVEDVGGGRRVQTCSTSMRPEDQRHSRCLGDARMVTVSEENRREKKETSFFTQELHELPTALQQLHS